MILGTLNMLKKISDNRMDGWMDGGMDDKGMEALLQYNLKHLLFLTAPPCFSFFSSLCS